jgi:DNA topoisomerase-1
MSKPVVIVESPTKVKTITKILGGKFKVVSSMGHLIDLPKSSLGIDVENNFEPRFIVVRAKTKMLTKLKQETKAAKEIYVATDPDREGEAIGWNLVEHLGAGKKIYRVTFQEITKNAILKAFEHPREFNKQLVNAQVGRRLLDRIVGYQISPLLWKKVGSRLSAGRVQSVALRIIVEREREIKAFIPKEYWQISVDLQKEGYTDLLNANLEKINGDKFDLNSQTETDSIAAEMREQSFVVSKITQRKITRKPQPPFITSTMQQDAFNKLRFNAAKTMRVAQELYEGIELEGGELVGLITYMRTDSVNISQESLEKVRNYIKTAYGEAYCPETPNKYQSKRSAQEAHEAIRPSDVERHPKQLRKYLSDEEYKLYELIWNRFVASQMVPAEYENKKIEIEAGRFQFGASGSTLTFDGYLAVNREEKEEESKVDFSHYESGDKLQLVEVKPTQHFTKPPPRYSDASLVKTLEENGIGRPSTYASIIQTVIERNYVVRDCGYFSPTDLGLHVSDLLVEYFPREMDIGFTATMENDLDGIEEGRVDYPKVLSDFYGPFKQELTHAEGAIVKAENVTDKICPLCGRNLVVKWGRRGQFLSCSGFPECKHAQPITLGIPCPNEGCDGEIIERKNRMGKSFYGCSRYPNCTYISNTKPETKSNDE